MESYSLPRTGMPPLEFRGELIVSQAFTEESGCYLDAQGYVRFGKSTWTWTIALYRTDVGRFVYHGHTRQRPSVGLDYDTAQYDLPEKHQETLECMELMRKSSSFTAGPLRLGTTDTPPISHV